MGICDPLLLINKLQTKFIAGPLPEYDRTWHIFKRMAEEHGADPKLAAKRRLRMLRVANEVMTESTKNIMGINSNNISQAGLATTPPPKAPSPTKTDDDLSSPLSGLHSQFSRTMVPPESNSANSFNSNSNTNARTDLNFGNVITAASNEWLQQYAQTLIQSGEYTEEDVALLTCEQTSLQLAAEYHRMLAILIQQHQISNNLEGSLGS